MDATACMFCGNHSQDVAITENGYTGLKCKECRLIYISPRPSPEAVINCYTHQHAALYAEAQFGFENVNRNASRTTIQNIRKIRPSGALLELGPGGGFFLDEARREGYDVHGIELNHMEAEWIRDHLKIPCEEQPLSPGSFDGKRFDIIYHRDVLSHLSDPISVFQDISQALNEHGLLVFETGNIADLDKKYYKYFSQFLYPDHLFFFGEKSIHLLLERTGFKSIEVSRQAILLQLILQKALWRWKDSLKDKGKSSTGLQRNHRPRAKMRQISLKRRLRNQYRVVNSFLVRLGTAVLPKTNRPLKLVVFATKDSMPTHQNAVGGRD